MIAHTPGPGAPRRLRAAAVLLATASVIVAPVAAHAASGGEPGTVGSVTVEPSTGLPEEGAEVVVRGTGFDPSAGVYVAVCVDNGPDQKPTPCIGGADTAGVGGAIWISDTPPSYAEGLTQAYGPDGSFEVTLPVPVTDEVAGVDCRVDACAVTVRFDHLRSDDRRADHVVPVSFGDAEVEETEQAEPTSDETDAVEETPEPVAAPEAEAADPAEGEADVTAGGDDGGVSPGAIALVAALAVAGVAVLVWLVRRRRPVGAPGSAPGSAPDPARDGDTDAR